VKSPDIIVFGLQEVVPLDKANVAKFLNKKKGLEGSSTTLHAEHRRWADKLVGAVTFALPDERYKLLYTKELVGLLSCVMIKTQEMAVTRNCAAHTVSRGVRGFGNKVRVIFRIFFGRLNQTRRFALIGCHCGQALDRQHVPVLPKLSSGCRTQTSTQPECGCCGNS